MNITAVNNLHNAPVMTPGVRERGQLTGKQSFDSVLNSVMSMVGETNTLQNVASSQEIAFALGESDNVHDLLIAEQKANIALQYTVAVRDKFIEGYNNIMNMQI